MPSPFPGMDPYLEDPALWPNVHQRLITYAADRLAPEVRPRYWVNIGERVYVADPQRNVYPDVALVRHPGKPPAPRRGAGTAVLDPVDLPALIVVPHAQVRQPFLEITDARGGHVVTVLEMLSPANKAPGPGRDLYLEKQRQVLESDANLVEIDLLRRGQATVAAPGDSLESVRPYHYLASVSRPGRRDRFEVYHVTVRQRLPRIGIPLAEGEPDVELDLTSLLVETYNKGGYADVLDYARGPSPPFSDEDAAWVRGVAGGAVPPNP